jgi:hypothetical protein
MRKLNGEIIGVRGVYGTISDANRGINASGAVWLLKMCIGSIVPVETSKVFRIIDFAWRGNYLNTPDTQRFSVKDLLIFYFGSYFQLYTIYAKQ